MVDIPYPLITERLVLRRFSTDDLADYYSYQSLPETARYLYGGPRSYALCMAKVGQFAEDSFDGPGDWATFAVELQEKPGMIGELALKWNDGGKPEGPEPERFGEIGWTLAPWAQGKGYATEAARAILALALDQLGFHRVEARLDARNGASAAICERLGMQREGVMRDNMYLKGEWTSEAVYATVRS